MRVLRALIINVGTIYDTNLYIKLDPSEGARVEELNREPTVNQPREEAHHEPLQENQRPKRNKKLPDWLRDYVV